VRKSEAHTMLANAFPFGIFGAFRILATARKAANCRVFNGQPQNVVTSNRDLTRDKRKRTPASAYLAASAGREEETP
jgi:hypothetical protein